MAEEITGALHGTLTFETVEVQIIEEAEHFEIIGTYKGDSMTITAPFGSVYLAGAKLRMPSGEFLLENPINGFISVEATDDDELYISED